MKRRKRYKLHYKCLKMFFHKMPSMAIWCTKRPSFCHDWRQHDWKGCPENNVTIIKSATMHLPLPPKEVDLAMGRKKQDLQGWQSSSHQLSENSGVCSNWNYFKSAIHEFKRNSAVLKYPQRDSSCWVVGWKNKQWCIKSIQEGFTITKHDFSLGCLALGRASSSVSSPSSASLTVNCCSLALPP